MKVKSSRPKGGRVFKDTHKSRPYWIEPVDSDLWFDVRTGQWTREISSYTGSCYYAMDYYGFNDIWSLKAALRKIRKWDVPKGTQFKVELPFVGFDFLVTK